MSTTKKYTISTNTQGNLGTIYEITPDEGSVLVFRMPRRSDMVSNTTREEARMITKHLLPPDKQVLLIGYDVDIYELAGEAAVMLILRGDCD